METLSKVLDAFKNGLGYCISKVAEAVIKVVELLQRKQDKKEKKEKKELLEKDKKEVEDICNNGSLEDLFNKFIKATVVVACIIVANGCTSTQVVVDAVKPWEGHYMTVEEFHEKTGDIKLEKKESIWVLSNRSLIRVLESQRKREQ